MPDAGDRPFERTAERDMRERLKGFFASGLFLAASGVSGLILLIWPMVSIPAGGAPGAVVVYIYSVWTALILAAGLWAHCQGPEPPAEPGDEPPSPPDSDTPPAGPRS